MHACGRREKHHPATRFIGGMLRTICIDCLRVSTREASIPAADQAKQAKNSNHLTKLVPSSSPTHLPLYIKQTVLPV